jgi:hypothetical protein
MYMSGTNVQSVVQLLSVVLASDPTMQKCAVKLNPETVSFLNDLLKNSPGDLEKFQQLFTEITADGKVDINDVPEILALLKTMYSIASKSKQIKVTVDDVVKLTKFILTELATVKGVNQQTIKQILIIVESASEFLTIAGVDNKSVVNVSGLFKKFHL